MSLLAFSIPATPTMNKEASTMLFNAINRAVMASATTFGIIGGIVAADKLLVNKNKASAFVQLQTTHQ